MGEMFGLLDQPKEIVDKIGAKDLCVDRGQIEFRDVHFHYEPNRPILSGVDLTLEPGKSLAIVGATGAGKSSIGRLLFRFYDVTKGAILILSLIHI